MADGRGMVQPGLQAVCEIVTINESSRVHGHELLSVFCLCQ